MRVRYNRRSLADSVRAARRVLGNTQSKSLFIYATALGFTIQPERPVFLQSYVEVFSDGRTHTFEPVFERTVP